MLKKISRAHFKLVCNRKLKSNKISDLIILKQSDNSSTNLISMNKQENYLASSSKIYYDMVEEHYKMRIPFLDHEYYKRLLAMSKQIANNENLESWDLLDRYFILKFEDLEMEFLVDLVYNLSQIKWLNFDFWYFAEKRITKDIKLISNNDLAIFIYSFGTNDQGSNNLFDVFANEVLDRKIRNFNKQEYEYIYTGFKQNKIRDKLLWAILEKAKIELNY